jgi:hypothetical protein
MTAAIRPNASAITPVQVDDRLAAAADAAILMENTQARVAGKRHATGRRYLGQWTDPQPARRLA